MSLGREQAGQHAGTLTGPPQRGHRIAPSIGVDQSFQGLDQLGVMMDQRLSSGPRMPDSLNGEGALRKALDGPIDGRARKTSNTGDDGNTSSSQSLAIEGCNQVLLSLIEVRKQQGVLPLKFFGFAHSRIIPSPPSFVTLNFLQALTSATAATVVGTGATIASSTLTVQAYTNLALHELLDGALPRAEL